MTAEPESLDSSYDELAVMVAQANALAARIAGTLRAAARQHVDVLIARGITDPEDIERVITDRVGRTLHISPTVAGRRVRSARDLHDGLDHVRSLFIAGRIDQDTVAAITDASRHLSSAERAQVDQRLAASRLETLSLWRARNLT